MIEQLKAARLSILPCKPPIWARTGHLQTMIGHVLPSPKVEEIGETLNITLERPEERIVSTYLKGEGKNVLYLFHGLAGNTEASYMQRTALIARGMGFHVFLNNHRGCGEGSGLASEPYHSGRAEDLSAVIAYGRKMLPDHFHVAAGFSLSANALLLLAAGVRADVLPDMAIAVNAPINLNQASLNLVKGANRFYNFIFMLELRRYVMRNIPANFPQIKDVWELRHFDEAYTARIGGFKDRADYYQTCSAKQYLSKLKIPTVVMTAKDDPFVAFQDYAEAQYNSQAVLHFEEHGGHIGYLNKNGKSFNRWLDQALETYLTSVARR